MNWKAAANKPAVVFVVILVCVLILYQNSYGTGFTTDFTGLYAKFSEKSFSEFMTYYSPPVFQPILYFLNYSFLSLFGLSPLAWFIYYVLLHSLVIFLVFQVSRLLFRGFGWIKVDQVAIVATVLFLLSPFHAEILNWKVSTAYLWSAIFLLNSLFFMFQYLRKGSSAFMYSYLFWQILALLTFEWGIVSPAAILLLAGALVATRRAILHLGKRTLFLFAASCGTVIAYLLAQKAAFGSYLGHYGEAVHLKFDGSAMLGTIWAYFVKHSFFVHFYVYETKANIYNFLRSPAAFWLTLISLLFFGILVYAFRKSKDDRSILSIFLLALFALYIVPVSNLSFEFLFPSENDRYGFLASIFLAMFWASVFMRFHKYVWVSALMFLLPLKLFLLNKQNKSWAGNAEVYHSLLDNYTWQDESKVYLLNVPENFNGTFMFRDYSDDACVKDALNTIGKNDIKGDIVEVMHYNMYGVDQGARVEKDSIGNIKVFHEQFGTWFWKHGSGSSNHTTDQYQITHGEGHYVFKPIGIDSNSVILYQKGGKWFEVD